jgi:putative cardiolipin synthase
MSQAGWSAAMGAWLHIPRLVLSVAILGGCASLPPGSDFHKLASATLAHPEQTRLGRQFGNTEHEHGGESGFRILAVGTDGFLIRMQMINAAERTLDLQYYIFHGDDTGRLLTGAVLHAADRGVRIRILVDDGETISGDEQLTALEAHPSIELRIFNPFAYRGHSMSLRALEFVFNAPRLDYRMHNKLLVVDNALALMGGRNIGDQYFQIDPESQFADDDVFAAGPVVQQLSATFDEYWNSDLAIPAEALSGGKSSHATLNEHREEQGSGGCHKSGAIRVAVGHALPDSGRRGHETARRASPAQRASPRPDQLLGIIDDGAGAVRLYAISGAPA